jgi:hypothetical protein
MEMLFVGPMPPKDFLKILLNVDHDTDNPIIDLSPFQKFFGGSGRARNAPTICKHSILLHYLHD